MADDRVVVKVETEENLSGVKAIDNAIDDIKREKIQLRIDAKTEQLKEADTKLANLKKQLAQIEAVPPHLRVNVDEAGINKLRKDISSLEQKKANLKLDIEKSELEQTKSEIQAMENDPINVQLETQTAMMALDQISQGFDRLKQGASELKNQMGEVLEASGRMENTETFLSMNIGAEQAKKKMEEIRSVTDQLPGDDVTLQNLLSQATIKDANMTAEAMTQMGSAAADYMAGMQNFGKTATETQQDLMNYILAGNTAEIERSPILQAHVDKLKEATTVQERSKALQEALTAEGWNGISQQDTYNNKLQKFNDMLTRGKMNLGDMFREPTEQAMEFVMKLDEASGGLIGMSAAAAQMVSPLSESALGLVQFASGLKNLGAVTVFQKLKDGFIGLKINAVGALTSLKTNAISAANTLKSNLLTALTSLKNTLTTSIIPAIKNAALSLLTLGHNALTAGANALASAAGWVAQKVALVASTIASYAQAAATQVVAAAQAFLNMVMMMNPIMLVVIAIVALVTILVILYQNVDSVRQAIDTLWQGALQAWNSITSSFMGIYNSIKQALSNAINSVTSFVSNLVSDMTNGAMDAVNGFFSWIGQMASKLEEELNKMLDMAGQFAMDIANKLTFGGAGMVAGWISGSGESSPGYMYDHFVGELKAMEKAPGQFDLSSGMADAGSSMVNAFNPNLGSSSAGVIGTNNITINIESVDNEDRIQEIVNAVEEALKFDNLTAGRTA